MKHGSGRWSRQTQIAARVGGFPWRSALLGLLIVLVGLAAQRAVAQDDRPSWRPAAPEAPEAPDMPPRMERPEMEFEVDRESLRTTPDQFRIRSTTSVSTGVVDPELGRVATWRERMQNDRSSQPSEPAAPEPGPEARQELAIAPPVAAPASPPTAATVAPPPAGFRLSPSQPVQPDYPREALLDRVEGWVDVEIMVAPDGSVQGTRVVDAEPRRVFDKSALRAAQRWQFEPPAASGVDSPQRGVYRFEFNMDG